MYTHWLKEVVYRGTLSRWGTRISIDKYQFVYEQTNIVHDNSNYYMIAEFLLMDLEGFKPPWKDTVKVCLADSNLLHTSYWSVLVVRSQRITNDKSIGGDVDCIMFQFSYQTNCTCNLSCPSLLNSSIYRTTLSCNYHKERLSNGKGLLSSYTSHQVIAIHYQFGLITIPSKWKQTSLFSDLSIFHNCNYT